VVCDTDPDTPVIVTVEVVGGGAPTVELLPVPPPQAQTASSSPRSAKDTCIRNEAFLNRQNVKSSPSDMVAGAPKGNFGCAK